MFVKAYSRRSDWNKNAHILNSKCNPSTPFPLNLQHPSSLFDDAWSNLIGSGQPAGTEQRAGGTRRGMHVITHSSAFAAFHVSKSDTRVTLRELTHGSTVIFPGSYTLVMSISNYSSFAASDPRFFDSLHTNISNGISDGFKLLLSARNGSVFSLPLDIQMRVAQESGQVRFIMEGSALVIALNATEPSSYDGWFDRAIAAFHSKAPSSAIQNLVSQQTFKV